MAHVEALRAGRRAADALHMLAAALRIAHEASRFRCPISKLDEIERLTVAPDRAAALEALSIFGGAAKEAALDVLALALPALVGIIARRWCGPGDVDTWAAAFEAWAAQVPSEERDTEPEA